VTAIIGGLGAALLWAIATLCSSRSSRMLGSRVVLAWVMIVGVVVGVPIAAVSPPPASLEPSTLGLLLIAGVCYVIALQITYAALKVGKVSIVAPIVATEGATGAVIAVLFGASLSVGAALMLGVIVVGVVLSTLEPDRKDVPAGDFDVVADTLDEPMPAATASAMGTPPATASTMQTPPATSLTIDDPAITRRTAILAMAAALVFGIGLVASGRSASFVPVAWVALSARLIGLVAVVLPLLLQRRLRLTRAALPLVVIAGTGEVLGSMLGAWGSRESIPITAVMGSQFAAFAAVAAFLFFGERLGRLQTIGVVVIVAGITALAALQV
jgi:drug/metabolite transporter (DMT)-like permease